MLKERDIYLKVQSENKANGFYERKIASTLGSLGLSIPRDRKSDFRPALMPDLWKRTDDSFQDVLLNLILQSYSPNKIKSLLTSLNLPYSNNQIEELRDELCFKAKELRSKELPDKAACIFIDAYHCNLKDDELQKIRKAVIYSFIGITLDGYKDLFGYYILQGSETKEDWISIFNDLISRGLKRTMLIVSDDFSGLSDAVKTIFPT
jgi:putative transposase